MWVLVGLSAVGWWVDCWFGTVWGWLRRVGGSGWWPVEWGWPTRVGWVSGLNRWLRSWLVVALVLANRAGCRGVARVGFARGRVSVGGTACRSWCGWVVTWCGVLGWGGVPGWGWPRRLSGLGVGVSAAMEAVLVSWCAGRGLVGWAGRVGEFAFAGLGWAWGCLSVLGRVGCGSGWGRVVRSEWVWPWFGLPLESSAGLCSRCGLGRWDLIRWGSRLGRTCLGLIRFGRLG